jgi:hypothetical protein
MKMSSRVFLLQATLLLTLASALATVTTSRALAQNSESAPDPRSSYDLGVHTGTLLPSRIRGVRELIPGWGLRASAPTRQGVFEISGYTGRASGQIYNSLALSYRMDIDLLDVVPAHFVIGLHSDSYEGVFRNGTPTGPKFTGGWHYGGGLSQPLAGPFLLRGDFRSRFGPGQSLEITIGLIYRIPSSGFGR